VQGVAGTCERKVLLGHHHGEAQQVGEELTRYICGYVVSKEELCIHPTPLDMARPEIQAERPRDALIGALRPGRDACAVRARE
jgi:hypothetical protein